MFWYIGQADNNHDITRLTHDTENANGKRLYTTLYSIYISRWFTYIYK